ncbi:MAG: fibronectin type III domain-containing protein, partial [Candidatus Promineifilaceae bacterium]|nr:fibronectin type III domain-containing protein [Candidatus Promineifilaceae bacterium]
MTSGRKLLVLLLLVVGLLGGVYAAHAWSSVPVDDDHLVRMPGTQPGQVALENPNRCLNCHAGYNQAVEPGFNWQGSMMAQSARDFLFWACLTVGAQDSIWAVGTPNATDICERCHFPKGWLEGRSDPTNASLMTGADYDGVQCDFCHSMYDPFFEETSVGEREGSDWLGYWDETNQSDTPSQPAADTTYAADAVEAQSVFHFNGQPFFTNNLPPVDYTENASGQYFVSADGAKRASFADADARHQMLYSRYHKSKYFCASCHDVSNPILANLGADPAARLPTESGPAYSYFHVERTFSEFMLSAYGQQGGAATNPEFQNQGAPDITHAAKCQDCHMRDVPGEGANKRGVIYRPDGSIEHPNSGQPLHDMTGGNAWVSWVLASAVPGSPNYDAINDSLLNQGPAVLTLDLSQGQGINPEALLAGSDRAKQQLALATTIKELTFDPASGALSFNVQNNTGHKLISGFPEGRRMFVNIRAYSGGTLVYEINPYNETEGTLKGLTAVALLGTNEEYNGTLVYEMQPSSSLTGEDKTFHFALADGRYKDNRIPPKGFRIGEAADRVSVPVWQGVEADTYFTAQEYAGGYDAVSLTIPVNSDSIEVSVYYQTTSREYIEFLRDEINGYSDPTMATLSSPTPSGEASAYVVQTDPFFSQLRAWGDTIWQLWVHNMNVPGAAPILMAQATTDGGGVGPPTPTLLTAVPGNQTVDLTWSDEHSADANVVGYNVYYDQGGKAQLVASLDLVTAFVDNSLTNGQQYCYKVTSRYGVDSESTYSNILCATPENVGQQTSVGVSALETGTWVTTGKGKDKVTEFVVASSFTAGDTIIIRAQITDDSGLPVEGATVDLVLSGPETVSWLGLVTDAQGVAEASWATSAPNKAGKGGTALGEYTVTVTQVTATGYVWDGIQTTAAFTL